MFNSVSSLSERLKAVAQASVESLDHAGQAFHVRNQSGGTLTGTNTTATGTNDGANKNTSVSGVSKNADTTQDVASKNHGSDSFAFASGTNGTSSVVSQSGTPRAGSPSQSTTTTTATSRPAGSALASRLSGLITSSPSSSPTSPSSSNPFTSSSSADPPSTSMGRNSFSGSGLERSGSLQDRLRGVASGGRSGSGSTSLDGGARSSAPSSSLAPKDKEISKEAEEEYERLLKASDPSDPSSIPLPRSPTIDGNSEDSQSKEGPLPFVVDGEVQLEVMNLETSDTRPTDSNEARKVIGDNEGQTVAVDGGDVAAEDEDSEPVTRSENVTPIVTSSLFNTPRNHFPMTASSSKVASSAAKAETTPADVDASATVESSHLSKPEKIIHTNTEAETETGLIDEGTKADEVNMPAEMSTAELNEEIKATEKMLQEEEEKEKDEERIKEVAAAEAVEEKVSAEETVPSIPKTAESSVVADTIDTEKSSESTNPIQTKLDKVNDLLKAASPLLHAGADDIEALSGWITMVTGKIDNSGQEIRRLSEQLSLQETRSEELKESHRLELMSSTALIQQLRNQITKSEANLSSQASQTLQIAQLKADLTTSQTKAREEEEKRSKAIGLLKTVRSKLVKTEKEREEMNKEKEAAKAEKMKLVETMERQRAEREREISNLRTGFEKEVQGLKERYEREALARKREWELELITTKATHAKDLAAKSKTITALNEHIRQAQDEKKRLFEQLQSRQELLETTSAAKESFETRMKELQYQLRESNERLSVAEEALAEAQRNPAPLGGMYDESLVQSNGDTVPAGPNVSKLIADATHKADSRIAELRDQLARLERERTDIDEEHARQLRSRGSELDKLRTVIADREREYTEAVRSTKASDETIAQAEKAREIIKLELEDLRQTVREMRLEQAKIADAEVSRDSASIGEYIN